MEHKLWKSESVFSHIWDVQGQHVTCVADDNALHLFKRLLGTQRMTCVLGRPMFMVDPSPVLAPAPAPVRSPWDPTPGL
eukprot:5194625-Heterocapsa_arctica.AAC.1